MLWNRRNDNVDWVEQMSKIVGRYDARSGSRDTSLPDLRPFFENVQSAVFAHNITLSPDSLVGLVDTYSYVRLSPDRETNLGHRSLADENPSRPRGPGVLRPPDRDGYLPRQTNVAQTRGTRSEKVEFGTPSEMNASFSRERGAGRGLDDGR